MTPTQTGHGQMQDVHSLILSANAQLWLSDPVAGLSLVSMEPMPGRTEYVRADAPLTVDALETALLKAAFGGGFNTRMLKALHAALTEQPA